MRVDIDDRARGAEHGDGEGLIARRAGARAHRLIAPTMRAGTTAQNRHGILEAANHHPTPAALENSIAASIFGPMLPGGKYPVAQLQFAAEQVERLLLRLAEMDRYPRNGGQDHQVVDVEDYAHQRRRPVLVDDRFNAVPLTFAGAQADLAAAATCDHGGTALRHRRTARCRRCASGEGKER